MVDELLNWWKKLSHNEKKIFLANLDFVNSNTKIEPDSDLYSYYKIVFGIGIRQRLDNFHVHPQNIKEILRQKKLIFNHISFINLSVLEKFENLEEVYYKNHKIETINSFLNFKLKTLSIQCENLENIDFIRSSKIQNLYLKFCYKITNLEVLKDCENLKKLTINYTGVKLKAKFLLHIDEIFLNKNLIYPFGFDYLFYDDKYASIHNFINYHILNRKHLYRFNEKEIILIVQRGNECQQNNYMELIESKIYSIYLNSDNEWKLIKN